MNEARLVQAGVGDARDLVVVYFLAQQNDGALRAAAPGAIIVNDTRTDTSGYARAGGGGVEPLLDLVPRLEAMLKCSVRSVTLCGWSIGCKAVRSQLLSSDGAGVDAVVAMDGTAANFPTPDERTQIKPWKDFAEQAKAGEKVMVATHTMLTYTEHLPQPFMATWHVLQRVTGFTLAAQGPNDAPVLSQEGQLTVWSYAAADAAGHTFQGREALPRCLAQALARVRFNQQVNPQPSPVYVHNDEPPTTDPSPGSIDPWRDPSKTLGVRCLLWAQAQLDAGKREEPKGSNSGPFVIECLAPCVREGVGKLNLTAGNWCAAFACASEDHARLDSDAPAVHGYRCSGLELEADARKNKAWRCISEWRADRAIIDPGDVIIFDHGTAAEPWRRHVVRFRDWSSRIEGRFNTIGGNEGDGIMVSPHRMDEREILGFIGLPHPDPSVAQALVTDDDNGLADLAERWRRLTGLSDAVMRGAGDDIAAIMEGVDPNADGKPGE